MKTRFEETATGSIYNKIPSRAGKKQISTCLGCNYRTYSLALDIAREREPPRQYSGAFGERPLPACLLARCLVDGLVLKTGAKAPSSLLKIIKLKNDLN